MSGLLLGAGFLVVIARLPINRKVTLAERVEPYIRDTPATLILPSAATDKSLLSANLVPLMRRLGTLVERLMGGATSVVRRQQRAGVPVDVEGFRAQQALWGVAGCGVGATLGGIGMRSDGSFIRLLALMVVGFGSGLVAKDMVLTHAAQAREATMAAEFPTVAELLALAVAAGEGAVGALDRVARLSKGEMSAELGRALAEARSGATLPRALQGIADRTGLISLTRFVDGIIVAVERGTPLAEVLRAQAQDVREDGRRRVMEEGGKKEILMMIPVVFLILPVTVLFAIFPGFYFLNFSL